jgi:uncharacterized protein (DUF2062 family)
MLEKIKGFLKIIYLKIIKIDDSVHKISLGFAIGVALGIIPGTGPLAALIFAILLRANRASALIGSLLVNTWFSIITLIPAAKIGALLFNLNWHKIYTEWLILFSSLRWQGLIKVSLYKIILPIILGYVILALGSALVAYTLCRIILKINRYGNKKRDYLSW